MSSQPHTATLETINDDGHGLRVEFHSSSDRICHTIFLTDGRKSVPALGSNEGHAVDLCPPSPCLTELHQQDETLFLTGATASCYWSMSANLGKTFFPEKQYHEVLGIFRKRLGLNAPAGFRGTRPLFQFLSIEVACRLQQAGEVPGSTYRLANGFQCHAQPNYTSAIIKNDSIASPRAVVLGATLFGNLLEFHPKPKCLITPMDDTSLRIGPADLVPQGRPATLQWRYCVWVL